jgi:transcription initiation factor TFIID subunit 1
MFAMLPVENDALISGQWVNDIIWNIDNTVDHLGPPPILTLDLNDENIILDIPEDKEPVDDEEQPSEEPLNKKDRVRLSSGSITIEHFVMNMCVCVV